MMNQSLVSIIVPVYNAELYLEKCLESLLTQSMSNIEIIIVNDGSTDNSSGICREYSKKDTRIKYYEIPNSGVSIARNTGISYATSEWITFVDSDDWVSPNYCKILSSYIDETVDLIIGRTFSVEEGVIMEDSFIGDNLQLFRTEHEKKILYESIVNDSPNVRRFPHLATCSAKLFRKQVIDNNYISYKTNLKYYEDAIFNMEAIFNSKSVAVVADVLYYYRMNSTSATQSFAERTILYYENAYEELVVFSEKNKLLLQKDYYCFNIKNLNTILTNYFKIHVGLMEKYRFVKETCSKKIFFDAINRIHLSSIGYRRRVLLVLFVRLKLYWGVVYLYDRRKKD